MKKLAITKAGFTAFTNAMHVELHTRILAALNGYGASTLNLDTKAIAAYTDSVAKEQDYVNHNYSSVLTPQIVKARTLRNNWYRYVRYTIEATQYSPVTAMASAYATLEEKLLKIYPPLSEMADGQNATAQIRGFVQAAQGECKDQIDLLELTDDVATLAKANEDFATKYQERNAERAQAVPAEMAATRTQTDTLYRTLAYVLQGQSLQTTENAEQQAVYTKCASAVAEIGTLLGDWQYRLRLSRKGAVVAPTEGSSEDLAGDNEEVEEASAAEGLAQPAAEEADL
jgi:hypothetical protein